MKKQFIRRTTAILLSLTFLFSLTLFSSAANQPKHDVSKNQKKLLSSTKIREYDMLKQLQSQSDDELKNKGLSESEIKEIKDFDFAKALKARATKNSDKELSSLGYSADEISVLRDSNSTELQLAALSATLTLEVSEYGHFYTSSLSEVYLETYFEWDSFPVFYGSDIIATAWSDGMYCQVNNQVQYETYCSVNYYMPGNRAYYNSYTYNVIADTNNGAHVKFPLNVGPAYALSGYMQTYITKQAAVQEIAVLSKYGHSTISVSPTVSFTSAPTIGFSTTMTNAGEDSMYINLTVPY